MFIHWNFIFCNQLVLILPPAKQGFLKPLIVMNIFDDLSRGHSLSQKFADLSGTEPVQLFVPREPKPYIPPSPPPKTFNYSPQGSYDALPGPSPLIPATTVSPQQNPSSSTPQQFVDDEVIDYQPTMEERRGEYILRPFVGIQLPRDQKFHDFSAMN